jgi:tRNA U55 pseudouridine synthase TruB
MSSKPVALSASDAHNHISLELRNNIYSALLSGDGIRSIEGTLDRQLAESGFKDELRRYVTDLFRSGQATTVDEARALAMDKIKHQMQGDDEQTNGISSLNGANGDDQKYDLKIPHKAIVEGTKSVRKELEKVCDITEQDS